MNFSKCSYVTPLNLFIGLVAFLAAAPILAQNYQVVIYNPPTGFNETRGEGIGGQQRVGAARIDGAVYPENTHAFLWIGNSTTPIDLHPAGANFSKANATNGSQQVGYVDGNSPPYVNRRAALWNGTAGSVILLSPEGYYAEATSIAGNEQVGYVDYSFPGGGGRPTPESTTYIIHASIWHGSAESMVDLHPTTLSGANSPGDQRSRLLDTDGTNQVGYAYFITPTGGGGYTSSIRALLWHGSPQSVVELHPAGWDHSYAYGVKNNTQVGYGIEIAGDSPIMAFVWHGTAQSRITLGEGTALDTNGNTHVGAIGVNNSSHAFRWDGDSGSGFDLHNLLPPGYTNSGANDINDAGDIIGWAQNSDGYLVGVLWSVSTPNAPPSVTLSSPNAKGEYIVNQTVVLMANANDGDGTVSQVEFFANGASAGISTVGGPNGTFGMKWKPSSAGSYLIRARATDNGGGTTMSPAVRIRVSNPGGPATPH